MSLHKIRRKVMINGYGSARRRRWAQLSRANLVEGRLPDYVSRSRLRPVQGKRMKRASNEKECRALVASSLRHNRNSARSRSSGSKGARLLQRIRNRVADSPKVGKEDNRDKRHRQGSNNFSVTNASGSECENSGAAFVAVSCCSVRCPQRSKSIARG